MTGTLPNRTIDISSIVPGLDGKVRPHDPFGLQGGGLRYLLDGFDYPDNLLPQVFDNGGAQHDQWIDTLREGPIDLSVSPTGGLLGGKALRVYSEMVGISAPYQVSYYNNRNNQGFGVNNWWYLIEWLESLHSVSIPRFRLNRLRFWVKLPEATQFRPANSGQINFHFGTYCRRSNASRVDNESDNNHYYHEANLGYTGGAWHQVIIDAHPSHQRSANGSTDQGVRWSLFTDRSYFDAMTYFYVQQAWSAIDAPAEWFFDGFEMYEDTNPDENIEYIYTINGVKSNIVPNQLRVGWLRRKDDNSAVFNVRYAFSSFARNGGFTHGVAAPSGTGLTGFGNAYGYNSCEYVTTEIDLTGRDVIYFAVERAGQPGYREIAIPLTNAGYAAMGVNA